MNRQKDRQVHRKLLQNVIPLVNEERKDLWSARRPATLILMRSLWNQLCTNTRIIMPQNKTTVPPVSANATGTVREFRGDLDDNGTKKYLIGNGPFGNWIVDKDLPAYAYSFDQHGVTYQGYPNSRWRVQRDHWHQIGNDRITAHVSNDGIVQVYVADRGGTFLNLRPSTIEIKHEQGRYAWSDHTYGGGYAYVKVSSRANSNKFLWPTAYLYQSEQDRKTQQRVFGMGYVETYTENDQLGVRRQIHAPKIDNQSDDPILLIDVEITNRTDDELTFEYYEYWDVNVQQLRLQWERGGFLGPNGDAERRELNWLFQNECGFDGNYLYFVQKPPVNKAQFDDRRTKLKVFNHDDLPNNGTPPPEMASDVNWYPPVIFLADFNNAPEKITPITCKQQFFGAGTPLTLVPRLDQSTVCNSNQAMPHCMVLKRSITLNGNDRVQLRFGLGVVYPSQINNAINYTGAGELSYDDKKWRDEIEMLISRYDRKTNSLSQTIRSWKQKLAYFSIGDQNAHQRAIHREVAWHGYSLLAGKLYNEFFKKSVVPQGSIYLYVHGADGAPRDLALYSLALIYLEPKQAREQLTFIMSLTDGTNGKTPYCYAGHGHYDGALIHENPSDFDLFILLAVTEYMAATQDTDFLGETVQYYHEQGQGKSTTVYEHICRISTHFLDQFAPAQEPKTDVEKLIRISDGDWSDGIVTDFVTGQVEVKLAYVALNVAITLLINMVAFLSLVSSIIVSTFVGVGIILVLVGILLFEVPPWWRRLGLPIIISFAAGVACLARSPRAFAFIATFGINYGLWEIWLSKTERIINDTYNITVCAGRSIPNTQMAYYVLPRVTHLLEKYQSPSYGVDEMIRSSIVGRFEKICVNLREGLDKQWVKDQTYYNRAILFDHNKEEVIYHEDKHVDLEAQVWGLISRHAEESGKHKDLIETIYERLDSKTQLGAYLPSGQVWPAISQLLTWAYAIYDPVKAWRSFYNQTFLNQTEVLGEAKDWQHVLSGSDGLVILNELDPIQIGKSGNNSIVTPTADFPCMNNNQHAMALLALIRICGIEPTANGDGLIIKPARKPAAGAQVLDQYKLELPLLALDVSPTHISGEYRGDVNTSQKLYVHTPENAKNLRVRVNDKDVVPDFDESYVVLTLMLLNGTVQFDVTWEIEDPDQLGT